MVSITAMTVSMLTEGGAADGSGVDVGNGVEMAMTMVWYGMALTKA